MDRAKRLGCGALQWYGPSGHGVATADEGKWNKASVLQTGCISMPSTH